MQEEWVEDRSSSSNPRDKAFILNSDKLKEFLSTRYSDDGAVISVETLNYALVWHASKGCILACSTLLDAGADISANVSSLNDSTPLRSATIHGEDIARFLLTRGASVDTEGVVMTAGLYGHLSLLKLLVLLGADFHSRVGDETPSEAIRSRCDAPTRDDILYFLENEAEIVQRSVIEQTKLNTDKFSNFDINSSDKSNINRSTQVASPSTTLPRLMMSYCWEHQLIIKAVAEQLRQLGYEVWLDVDHMQGSTLDTMARAIEESDIILMGVSTGYKASTNCRLEAEYATIRKKTTIPLILEHQYR